MSLRQFSLLLLAAFAGIVLTTTNASAAFTIHLSTVDGGGNTHTATISDNGAGDILGGTSGVIGVNQNLGDFSIVWTGSSSNSLSGSNPAVLSISNFSFAAGPSFTGTRTLTITVKDTGFTAPDAGVVGVDSQASGTWTAGAGPLTFQSFVDGQAGTLLTLPTSPGAASATDTMTVGGTPFTISNVMTVSLSSNSLIQGSGTTTVYAPAPSGFILAAIGAPFFGLLARRLRRSEVPVAA